MTAKNNVEDSTSDQQCSIPKLAVSKLAKSYYHRCEKHVKLSASKSARTTASTPATQLITKAHCKRGDQFEHDIAANLGSQLVDHSNTPPALSRQALRDAQPGQVLYQLRFEMPDKFYTEEAQSAYRLGQFIPDFLLVKKDASSSAGKRICVIDAKSSKAVNTSHQFQVASYAYLLAYLVSDTRNVNIDAIGGVWLPGSNEPEFFRVDLFMPKMQLFYTEELPAIVSGRTQPDWIFNAKCRSCEFRDICREDAYGTPGAVPYLSESRLRAIKKADSDSIDRVHDIEDLADQLHSLSIQEKREKAVPHFMASQREYADYPVAYRTQKPQFRGYPIVTLARSNDHDILITVVVDPMHLRLCAYFIRVYDVHSDALCDDLQSSAHVSAQDCSPSQFSDLDERLVSDLAKVLSYMEANESRCTILLSSSHAKEQVQKCCLRITSLSVDQNDAVVRKAMDCLLALFQDSKMLSIPGTTEFPANLETKVMAPLVADVEQLVRQNVALGVPGYYTLQTMVSWLAPEHEMIDDEQLYEQWQTSDADCGSVDRLLAAQAEMLHAIVAKYRQLASSYEQETGQEVYCVDSTPFKWTKTQTFRSSIFGRLAFFKIMECLSGCNRMRSSRISDLTGDPSVSANRGLQLQFTGYEIIPTSDTSDKKLWLCWFHVMQESSAPVKVMTDSLSRNTMKEYIVVKDDREGMMQAVKFPDLAYRGKMYRINDAVTADVYSVSEDGLNVALVGYMKPLGLKKGHCYRLYKRYIDFNTDKILDAMLQIDQRGNSAFEELITDPNAWADTSPSDDAVSSDARATALRLRDDFKMSPSQKAISANIIQKRLQVVWGPPGSGKTEFLALFINWYIMHLFTETTSLSGQPFIIGVTAFTRHAILNLLRRIATVRQRHPSGSFAIISMEGSGDAPRTHDNADDIVRCKADQLRSRVKDYRGQPLVVGGTVWDWHKVKRKWTAWQGCSMMIVDESSQLLVSDAAVAIDCLDQQRGRLIIAGDHMQLGPILHNQYPKLPASYPLLFGSIQQCLMRTEQNQAIPSQEFLLRKGTTHDFGPNTIQLKDNWRMNEELNSFFKQVYGDDLAAHYPKRILQHDWGRWKTGNVARLQAALDPKKSITLVKVGMADDGDDSGSGSSSEEEAEARVIAELVHAHLTTRIGPASNVSQVQPHVMVVTPHHRQRVAVERRLSQWVSTGQITVDTVEKMQGQESELVIACFAFNDVLGSKVDFLFDFKRWNVAISRARSKVIIVTTDYMLNIPKNKGHNALDLFEKQESAEGWGFICLLQDWTRHANAVVEWAN